MPKRPANPIDADLVALIPQVRAWLAKRVRERHLDDMVQLVLLEALRTIRTGSFVPAPRWPPHRALRQWLYAITWHQLGHHVEAAAKRRRLLRAHGVPTWARERAELLTPEDLAAEAELVERLCALPPKLRDVVGLVCVGATLVEAAAELGVKPRVAYVRLRAARRFVRRMLRWKRAR